MNTTTNPLERSAADRLRSAEQRYTELLSGVESRIANLPDTASPSDVDAIESESRTQLDAAESAVKEARRALESVRTISRARAATGSLTRAAGSLTVNEPLTYTDSPDSPSFFADLYAASRGSSTAAVERLQRNNREVAAALGKESRSTLTTSDFYAPLYLGNEYVISHRARRVFSSLVEQHQLPPYGETVTIPSYTAPTDAANPQGGDNSSLQSSAGTTSQLTAPVTTFAGYVDDRTVADGNRVCEAAARR